MNEETVNNSFLMVMSGFIGALASKYIDSALKNPVNLIILAIALLMVSFVLIIIFNRLSQVLAK